MNTFRIPALASALLLSSILPGTAEVSFEEGLKGHLGKLTEEKRPGMAVLVARDGKIVYEGGFGFADLEKQTPVTAATKFRIGSVTKHFVAAAILKLGEEGKLALTDSVEKYFPGFPGGDGITLAQLLTHTSGIHSYTSKPEFMARVTKAIEPATLIAWFRDDKADFAPGEGFLYNNSAYFLAGEVVAKVSGKSLDTYLRKTFFEPLGMVDTGIFVNASPPEGAALGYSFANAKAEPAIDWDMTWAGGAGALYSTVGDLFRWNEALFSGKVVNEASFKLMTTVVELPDGVDGMSYGYGLMMATHNRLPSIGHGGGLNGWSSDLVRFPDQNCTVIALANAMAPVPGFEPGAVTRNIAGKFLEAETNALPPVAENPDVDKKAYPDFAGRYAYQGAVLTVTVQDDHLMSQLTGQQKFEIFPSEPDTFFWKVADAQVTFLRDAKGVVVAARHTQGGASFKAPRITEMEVKLTEAELDAILGDYQYGPGAVMNVTRDGETVFAQLTGQPKHQIHAKSAIEYEWRVVEASVVFSKDDDGKVTKAVHTQAGHTFDAPKIK